MSATLSYRLPISCVRVTGTLVRKHDEALATTELTRHGVAELSVMADPKVAHDIELNSKLRDNQAAFTLTSDRRLTGSKVDVTGQGGAVVKGVVGVAAATVAFALRAMPLLAAAAILPLEDDEIDDAHRARKTQEPRTAEAAYLEAKPEEAALRQTLKTAVAKLSKKQAKILSETGGEHDQPNAWKSAWETTALLSLTQKALDRSEAIFAAWRATTIQESSVDLSYEITFDELRMCDVVVRNGRPEFPEPLGSTEHQEAVKLAQGKVRAAWRHLGCLVVIADDPPDKEPLPVSPEHDQASSLFLRWPRPVTLEFYTMNDEGKAVLSRVGPALVLDGLSRITTIDLNSGLFGKNTSAITFTTDGVPSGFDFGSSSSAAGLATAISDAPGSFASTLDSAIKVSDDLNALRNKGVEYELARTKSGVDLKQQQLTAAGLSATEKDFAELESLKQQAAILEQRQKLGPAPIAAPDPVQQEIAALRQQVELMWLRDAAGRGPTS